MTLIDISRKHVQLYRFIDVRLSVVMISRHKGQLGTMADLKWNDIQKQKWMKSLGYFILALPCLVYYIHQRKIHRYCIMLLSKSAHTHTHAHVHTQAREHTHANPRTHASTRTQAHARTHTHTRTQTLRYTFSIIFTTSVGNHWIVYICVLN